MNTSAQSSAPNRPRPLNTLLDGLVMPSLRLRLVPKLSALLSVLFLCVFCSTARAAATITVSSPASGATVNCVVTVAASMTFTPPDQQGDAVEFYFVDNLGNKTSLTGNPVQWDTTHMSNATVSIYATVPYHEGYTYYMANSAVITVTVQNGFVLSTDAAKTYAKVTQPTNGQSIIANGQNFVITSDHQITWTRYDNCGDYHQSYEFRRTCSYPNAFDVVVNGSYTLPKKIGDVQVQQTLGASPYIAGGGTPATYVVYAFCYTPDMNTQVASGNSNFTMTAPPH